LRANRRSLKRFVFGSLTLLGIAVFVLAVSSKTAKADTVTTVSTLTTGPGGSAGVYGGDCSGGQSGTFDYNSTGAYFLSASDCYFGGSASATGVITPVFASLTSGSGTGLASLANGTYYFSGEACNDPSSCNGPIIIFGVWIKNGTIIVSDSNPVISSVSGGSITTEFSDSVPEPSSLILLGSGLLALAGAGVFRKTGELT
jgi:hypothetical protein